MAIRRPVPLRSSSQEDLQREAAELRQLAQSRYSEVDLLVAALQEHIADLRKERDRLVQELDRAREREGEMLEAARREASEWLWRGIKPPKSPR